MIEAPELMATRLWAVTSSYLHMIRMGKLAAAPEVWAARGAVRSDGDVTIIPVMGLITQRGGYYGTSIEQTRAAIANAMTDSSKAVVGNIDSPGGEVYGMDEVASDFRELRKAKPVVMVANSLAASAAYNIAAQGTEVFVTPSGEIGSVGVYGMHMDWSAFMDQMGIKVTFVSAGEGKVDGNPYAPLSEETQAAMQDDINRYYGMFVANVRKGRGNGVTSEQIRDDWKAHVYGAQKAVEIGMADNVGTLDDAVRRARVLGRERSAKTARAEVGTEARMRARR